MKSLRTARARFLSVLPDGNRDRERRSLGKEPRFSAGHGSRSLILLRAHGAYREEGGFSARCRRPCNRTSGYRGADKSDRSERRGGETAAETLRDNWVRYGAHRSFCHRDLRLRDGRLLVRHKQLFTTAQPFCSLLFAAMPLSQFFYGSVFIFFR